MNKAAIGFAAVMLLIGGTAAGAVECKAPYMPDVPDTFADEAAKNATKKDVLHFMAESKEYLECLDAEEAGLGPDATAEAKQDVTKRYNANVDEQQAAANRYNAAARAFCDANPNSPAC